LGSGTAVPRGEAEALETRTSGAAEAFRTLAFRTLAFRTLAAEMPTAEMPAVGAVPGVPEARQTISPAQVRQAIPRGRRAILRGLRLRWVRGRGRVLPVYRGQASRGCHPRSATGPHHRPKYHWSHGRRQGHQNRPPQQRLRRARHAGRLQTLRTPPHPDLPLFQRPPQTPGTPRVPRGGRRPTGSPAVA
jgi:hypothetical protein